LIDLASCASHPHDTRFLRPVDDARPFGETLGSTTERRLVIGALALALGVPAVVASRALHYVAASMSPPRAPVVRPPPSAELRDLADVSFVTSGRVPLRGWYVPSQNRAGIILTHGYADNRMGMLPEARILARAGYGLLLFDWHAHGESGGDVVTWGDQERSDLAAAIAFMAARPDLDPSRLGVVGFSMGGYVVANVAAAEPRLRAIVLAGTTTSVEDLERDRDFWLPWLFLRVELFEMRRRGIDLAQTRPIDFVGAIAPRPRLVIAGSRDRFVPARRTAALFAAAREPKELWIVEGADHGEYAAVAPAEYERRLVTFFDRGLAPRAPP
jgi:dipeptidyl aminopeptidase/acylaminoacyl peptidase